MTWHQSALCATPEGDGIEWVPTEREVGGQPQVVLDNLARARRVCASCSVRGVCLDEAVRDNLEGIWGGTNLQERRRLRRSFSSPQFREAQQLRRLEKEFSFGSNKLHAESGEVSA